MNFAQGHIIEKLRIFARSGYFIYDLNSLAQHASELLKGNVKLFYACKANPLSAILKTLQEAGFCFDVASIGELQQVISLGILGENIIMTGPAKSKELISLGLQHKVKTFVVESPYQLMLLEELALEYDYKPNVLLRLQLQWHSQSENVLGGNKVTQFGVDIDTAKQLLRNIKLPFLGFHVFQWGNILSIDKLVSIWQQTINICKELRENFKVLNVGGGLGIPYSNSGQRLIWQDVAEAIKKLKEENGIEEFGLELGRYLTGPYGYYITKVLDRKTTYNKQILILEGGINHLARPALVNDSFPVSLLRDSGASLEQFVLYGPLCTSLDFLGGHELPSDVKVGDMVVFYQTGAYGFTESMPFFLCHNLPGEAIIQDQKITIVREVQPAQIWLK